MKIGPEFNPHPDYSLEFFFKPSKFNFPFFFLIKALVGPLSVAILGLFYIIIYQIERFSYDLEMKTREQNRNNKRTEIERFDWFIERTDKRAWLLIG